MDALYNKLMAKICSETAIPWKKEERYRTGSFMKNLFITKFENGKWVTRYRISPSHPFVVEGNPCKTKGAALKSCLKKMEFGKHIL